LQIDNHAWTTATVWSARPWIDRTTWRGVDEEIGMQFSDPIGRNVRNPQNAWQTQSHRENQRLHCMFTVDAACQKQTQPNQPRVMGLQDEADSQAQNTDRYISPTMKAPDGYNARTYSNCGNIADCKDSLAVGKKKAN